MAIREKSTTASSSMSMRTKIIYATLMTLKRQSLKNLQNCQNLTVETIYKKQNRAHSAIEALLKPLIEQTQVEAIAKVDAVIKELQENENFNKVPEADRYKVIRPRQELSDSIKATTSIDTIKQRTNADALADELSRGVETIFELIPVDEVVKPKQDTVRIAKLTPKNKITLKNSDDVNEYVEKLKENLLNEINQNKQILL